MKNIFLFLFCALICTKVFSQYPDNSYAKWPEWLEMISLKVKVQNAKFIPQDNKDELLNRFEKLKIVVDGFYYGTNEYCKESKELEKQTQLHNNNAADLVADVSRYKAAGCEGEVNESQYASCVAWHNKLVEWNNRIEKRKIELDNWGTDLHKWGYQLLNIEATNNNNSFITDAKEALSIPINIVITRTAKPNKGKCTTGELSVNGKYFCNTLELPFDNNNNNFSSIAVGKYDAFIGPTPNHPNGVIQLNNVTSIIYYNDNGNWKMGQINRNAGGSVEIHCGNTTDKSKGCILVGDSYSPTDDCYLNNTCNTLNKLYNDYFDRDSDGKPDTNIKITVTVQKTY